jgi:two-component system response regulator PilR (NtrC family)/two-component system KDP operon response regulator KdpE
MIQKITNPDNLSSVFCTPIGMDSKNVTVLIVDDEPDICFLLGNLLKQKNFETLVASTLAEGISMLKQSSPGLIFLDIHLPDGSGLDALPSIKKDFPWIKIIMMSAYDGAKERSMALDAGVNVFIGKPLNFEMITESLKKVMTQ